MRQTIIAMIALSVACGGPQTTQPVERPPVVEVPPEPQPEPEPAPQPEPEAEPEPAPTSAEALVRFSGRTVVAIDVERTQVRCTGATEGAPLIANRRACVADLQAQVKKADHLVVVIDELQGQGCATCVSMLAEVTPVASDLPGEVLFLADTAGEVTCTAGDGKMTLEQARTQCFQTLQKQGASLRAGVVLPMVVEDNAGCKGCTAMAGMGYTARVLPR